VSAYDPDTEDPLAEAAPADPAAGTDRTGRAPPRAGTSAALSAAVDAAATDRLRTEAIALAASAFEELLTPELHQVLQEQARAAMAAQLADDEVSAELEAAGPLFPTVQEWVEGFLAPTIVRLASNDFVWCPRWWAHAEVLSRLTGLWITWEQARAGSPADINTWWLQQLDPHLAVITAHGGPLNGCTQHDGHKGPKPGLIVEVPPPGTFGHT